MDGEKISTLKGIGPKTEALFHKLGIYTVNDVLRYYPRDYDEYQAPIPIQAAEDGQIAAVQGMIVKNPVQRRVRNLQIVSSAMQDTTGVLQLTWFNIPFIKNTVKQGTHLILRGKVTVKNGKRSMEQPELFKPEAYQAKLHKMQPIYPLTQGLNNKLVVKAVEQGLGQLHIMKEFLPEDIRQEYQLAEYNFSIPTIHFPDSKEAYMKARRRLVFEEFFLFILALRRMKEKKEITYNTFKIEEKSECGQVIASLPYQLTAAQVKVWQEIKADMMGEKVMARLVQGDVGSGKTILAVLAMILAAANGYQSALMAPTEVLAKQHFDAVRALLTEQGLPFCPVLLTGSMTAREKRECYEQVASGEAAFIIGTHALIQEKVEYQNLALVITDEQHRFGVRQREVFSGKGCDPHVLVMSATPIPRTLAIIIYGDLDISVVDEMPAERIPIKNCVVNTSYRPKAYEFIQKETAKGRQAYIICPMVEESETLDIENVTEYTQQLRQIFPSDISIEYLHGKMKQTEKNAIMERYAAGEIKVLVSTTVIEVGVNVPNASVMMVENAERFGLAQLHQLRGRVGRGRHQSYCIFVNGSSGKQMKKRLEILNQSNDGFFIANEDLKLRGPGDLFGIRQSGLLEFRIGDIFTDAKILQMASEGAQKILLEDEELAMEKHKPLRKHLDSYLGQAANHINL